MACRKKSTHELRVVRFHTFDLDAPPLGREDLRCVEAANGQSEAKRHSDGYADEHAVSRSVTDAHGYTRLALLNRRYTIDFGRCVYPVRNAASRRVGRARHLPLQPHVRPNLKGRFAHERLVRATPWHFP